MTKVAALDGNHMGTMMMGFWGYMCIQLHIDTFRELMIATDDFVPFGSFLYRKLADALASV